MALLLIKATPHWMDKLTEAEVQARADKDPGFMESYSARYQKGDVVSVREDTAPFGKKEQLPDFLIIKVEGKKADWIHLKEEETKTEYELKFDKKTMESYTEPYEKTTLRRKYKFDIDSKVNFSRLEQIETSKNWIIDTYDSKEIADKTATAKG